VPAHQDRADLLPHPVQYGGVVRVRFAEPAEQHLTALAELLLTGDVRPGYEAVQ
jgi:hypothetical protein